MHDRQAFPRPTYAEGMTIREVAAIAAMQTLIGTAASPFVAKRAIEYADALLAELDKERPSRPNLKRD